MKQLKSKVKIEGNYKHGYFIEIEDQYTKQVLAVTKDEMDLLRKLINKIK